MTIPRVRMSGIVRRFGSVSALDGADLELRDGEVHGVLGENGAGKTTLLSILAGMLEPDEGRVEIAGESVSLRSPRDAWAHGVGMVHQHFKLVPALTVLENLSLGLRTSGGGAGLPYRTVRARVAELERGTGLHVALDRPVSELSVGGRQRVEILKALLRDPRILVLDEPTAVLTPDEAAALFELLRGLARDGRAVALVAHKLDEVMGVSDRLTVLRGGRTVRTWPRAAVDAEELVRAMVGESRDADGGRTGAGGVPHGPARRAGGALPRGSAGRAEDARPIVAELAGVGVRGAQGAWAVRDASLEVRRGEIVGIAGVEGNGQRELALLLSGRLQPDIGRAHLPRDAGFVPQDRTTEGLIGSFDLVGNVALALHDGDDGGRWLMPWAEARRRAEEIRSTYGVQARDVGVRASALSGGNQQRLVVGRELDRARDLLVAENPMRGLDIAATAFVRGELLRRVGRSPGAEEPEEPEIAPGIVLVSSDLDEVLALSDRVFVMVRGRLVAVPEARLSREGVGAMMLGAPA